MGFRWLFAGLICLCAIACASRSQVVSPRGPMPDGALARKENERALQLIREGKYDLAEAVLKKAIEADVMFGPARNNLGLVYFHQDKLYPAAWEFQNAIKLMPHVPEPRNNLGLVFERAQKLTQAVEEFEKARTMQPDNPEFLANLARVKIRRGDTDEDTRKLLEELAWKDPRPQWHDWAKINLLRLNARQQQAEDPPRLAPSVK